jgi:hypothetical protein
MNGIRMGASFAQDVTRRKVHTDWRTRHLTSVPVMQHHRGGYFEITSQRTWKPMGYSTL